MANVLNLFIAGMDRASMRASETRLRELVEAHFDVLWRLLRRLGVPESEVDDAVQEVIVVVARRLDEVQRGSERAFVLSTGCRVASTLRRTLRRRRETSDDDLAQLADASGDPESLLQQRRARELLDEVLGSMPMELRTVFVLYELERFTCAEIAETLSIPAGTVASRLRRARAGFATAVAQLEPRELASPLATHASASRSTR